MKGIIKGVLVIIIILLLPVKVKGEQIIEVIIPDEIKICTCGCGCKNKPKEPQNNVSESDSKNLALQKIAIAEAGNTNAKTMAYVMQTVLNRVNSSEFPDDVESVIKQKGQFSTYPDKYNKAVPNEMSKSALELLSDLENKNQLYFENTVEGSWQSTNLEWVFNYNSLSFYK